MTEAQFDAKRGLAQIANKAQFLQMDFPSYEATMAELLELSMPSALAGDRTSGGDHSDPTLAGVFQRQRYEAEWAEYSMCAQKAIALLNRMLNLSGARPRFSGASEHLAARNAAYCNGGGVEPWANPLCVELAVTGTSKQSEHPYPGLCSNCDKARRRHLAKPEQQHRKRGTAA
jgi:hypothetical protein